MKRRITCSLGLAGVVASVVMAVGCAREVYAPPARPFPLEGKWTIPPGEMAIQGELSLNSALIGPGIVGSTVGVRRGINDRLEVSGEGALMRVAGVSDADAHPNIYAARLGTKLDLETARLAVTGGLGGGWAPAGGGFASVDVGLVSAYENCVLMPFGGGRVFASMPIGARAVDISRRGELPGTRMYTAANTFGINFNGGLEIPLDQRCQPRASLLMGVGVTLLGDGSSGEIFTNAGLSLQVRL